MRISLGGVSRRSLLHVRSVRSTTSPSRRHRRCARSSMARRNRATLFAAVLDELAQSPTILVIEDIHWADEATLDLHQIPRPPYRPTATLAHPDLARRRTDDKTIPCVSSSAICPARDVTRLRLLPLSEAAVATLASRPIAQPGACTPSPVAIPSSSPKRSPATRLACPPASPTPCSRASRAARRRRNVSSSCRSRAESDRALADRGAGRVGDAAALDECLAAEMLRLDGRPSPSAMNWRVRRSKARSPLRGGQALHAQVLHALLERGVEQTSLARLAHHAAAGR